MPLHNIKHFIFVMETRCAFFATRAECLDVWTSKVATDWIIRIPLSGQGTMLGAWQMAKRSEHEADDSPASSAESKNAWIFTSISPTNKAEGSSPIHSFLT